MSRFSLLLLASVAFSVGGVCMKRADGLAHLGAAVGMFTSFVAGAALLSLAMRSHDLSSTYAVGLGLEAAITFLVGLAVFGESTSMWRMAGVAVTVAGIVILEVA
jgi:quaternary ammonium compound-resistance protein SugE